MNSYFYNNLNPQEKAEYDSILNAVKNRQRSITIKNRSRFNSINEDILCNHPELFWKSVKTLKHGLIGTKVSLLYAYDQRQIQKLSDEIRRVSEKIIAENITDSQSDYDKVLVLHDYLKRTIKYDIAQKDAGVFTVSESAHNIVGALIEKKCVCSGFAKAMKFLCDKVGVECYVVTGVASNSLESGPHGWNVVKINGYYHHVDVTWDNQFSDDCDLPMYAYLNLSDEEIRKDHTWDRTICPACPDDPYNYFKMNRSLISSKAQLENFFVDNLSLEEPQIIFKVERGSLLEQQIMGCIEDCFNNAAQKCKYVSVKGYSYSCIPEQLVFSLSVEY